jgi:hypothetical protein
LDVFEDLTSSERKELEAYKQAYQAKLPWLVRNNRMLQVNN